MRVLDLVALRSVVMVSDCGSVTRAAEMLNLTQSAVSMQIRRLEDVLGQSLFERSQRRMVLSQAGERLVDYGRRMLRLNEDALTALGVGPSESEISIGLPHDLVSPHMPHILRMMAGAWPNLRLSLVVDFSKSLRQRFAAGEVDMILTTETTPGPGGHALCARPLYWYGVPDFKLREDRILRIAMGISCSFREQVHLALDQAGITAVDALDGDSDAVIIASVAAGMAVTARLEGTMIEGCIQLPEQSGLPALPPTHICYYRRAGLTTDYAMALEQQLLTSYGTSKA